MPIAEPIVTEQTFAAPAEKVWQALNRRNEMQQWYFQLAEFRPEPGFVFQFEGGDECRKFLHVCEVTEVIPFQKLAYTWRYEGYDGNSLVSFELFPEGEITRVKLTHTGLETFPESEPALARPNFVKGWEYIIGTALKEYLQAETVQIS